MIGRPVAMLWIGLAALFVYVAESSFGGLDNDTPIFVAAALFVLLGAGVLLIPLNRLAWITSAITAGLVLVWLGSVALALQESATGSTNLLGAALAASAFLGSVVALRSLIRSTGRG